MNKKSFIFMNFILKPSNFIAGFFLLIFFFFLFLQFVLTNNISHVSKPKARVAIEVIGKNIKSKGMEVWLYDPPGLKIERKNTGWKSTQSKGEENIIVNYEQNPQKLDWNVDLRANPTITFGMHNWSGIIYLTINDHKKKVDLYSEKGSRYSVNILKEIAGPYNFFLVYIFSFLCTITFIAYNFYSLSCIQKRFQSKNVLFYKLAFFTGILLFTSLVKNVTQISPASASIIIGFVTIIIMLECLIINLYVNLISLRNKTYFQQSFVTLIFGLLNAYCIFFYEYSILDKQVLWAFLFYGIFLYLFFNSSSSKNLLIFVVGMCFFAGTASINSKPIFKSNLNQKYFSENKYFNSPVNIYLLGIESFASIARLKDLGIHSRDIIPKLSKLGFSYFDLLSPGSSTLISYNHLFAEQNSQHFFDENDSNLFDDFSSKPRLKFLKEHGYKFHSIQSSYYFKIHKNKFWSFAFPEHAGYMDFCWSVMDSPFYMFGLCAFNFGPNPFSRQLAILNSLISEPNIQDAPPKFIFAHLPFLGHTALSYNFTNTSKRIDFLLRYQDRFDLFNGSIINMVSQIKKNDPRSVILILGDHGLWLSRGADEFFDKNSFIEDRFKVSGFISAPKNCKLNSDIKTSYELFNKAIDCAANQKFAPE
jgi:hypothetical protein